MIYIQQINSINLMENVLNRYIITMQDILKEIWVVMLNLGCGMLLKKMERIGQAKQN